MRGLEVDCVLVGVTMRNTLTRNHSFAQPWVAIQLAILDRLNHGLNHRPTGFYSGNAPKYAPK